MLARLGEAHALQLARTMDLEPTTSAATDTATNASPDPNADFWRKLLHRWLVQYNPLYLLSASLCLAGMILCSRGLAHGGSAHGELVVALIAEVYAGALIGGAALLTRIGQRRPAVMLALITALYQCDLTLHTEASACLGSVGVAASAVWAALRQNPRRNHGSA